MEWRRNRADCCRTISMKYFEMKVLEIAEESGQPPARHMDLSFSSRQSRFKDKQMIYRNRQQQKKHPLKQGCVDNIDLSRRTLTDKKTLWPRCGRHMLGLNRRLCLVDGGVVGVWLVLRNEDFVTACFLRSCHRRSRWITHAEFSCRLCQEPRGILWRTGLVFLP